MISYYDMGPWDNGVSEGLVSKGFTPLESLLAISLTLTTPRCRGTLTMGDALGVLMDR